MSTILEGKNLTRHYEVRKGLFGRPDIVKALNGVNLSLEPGKTLAVVGESGCGKSTLARLVTMIEEPTEGDLIIDGRKADPTDKAMRRTVQIVFQNPYGSLNPRQKVGAILEEPLVVNSNVTAAERKAKAKEMMARVGLRPEHYERFPHMFSGGQRQRIAIARALMLNPKILVLDEPVSALDLSIQAQVLNILIDLQKEFGLAYLFISHDLSVVKHIADEVLVMYLGRVIEQGSAERVFEDPRHPYTRALLSATPIADPTRKKERVKLEGELPSPLDIPSGCAFHPRCPIAVADCGINKPELREVGGRLVSCHLA